MGNTNAKLQMMLSQAVIEDNPDKVRELLKMEEMDVNYRGEKELTAMQLAIVNGSLKSLQVFLENSQTELDSLTPERQTPLILAAAKGQEDIALCFMERVPENLLQLEFSDLQEQQVLHYACAGGQERLVQELLHRNVDVDAVGGKLRHTPLMLAAQNGHESVMRILLAAGAQKSAVDLAKMTPLHHACMHASESCVQLLVGEKLLEKGVAEEWVNARDISGCTPLLYCLNNKNRVLEKLLVSHGASLTEALDGGFSEYCYHTSS